MKTEITSFDIDTGEYTLEYDEEAKAILLREGVDFLLLKGLFGIKTDEVVLACEHYAKDRDERLKAQEAIATMTEYWENPS